VKTVQGIDSFIVFRALINNTFRVKVKEK